MWLEVTVTSQRYRADYLRACTAFSSHFSHSSTPSGGSAHLLHLQPPPAHQRRLEGELHYHSFHRSVLILIPPFLSLESQLRVAGIKLVVKRERNEGNCSHPLPTLIISKNGWIMVEWPIKKHVAPSESKQTAVWESWSVNVAACVGYISTLKGFIYWYIYNLNKGLVDILELKVEPF